MWRCWKKISLFLKPRYLNNSQQDNINLYITIFSPRLQNYFYTIVYLKVISNFTLLIILLQSITVKTS